MQELHTTIAGTPVTIRPIRITDADMEAEFVRRLSPKSKHYRFLGGVRELSPEDVKHLCNVDERNSMAFVATVQENGQETEIGVSRYAPGSEQDTYEMAVAVADEWQHKGLGTLLTKRLIEFAKGHGVKKLYSVDFEDNRAMQELANDLSLPFNHPLVLTPPSASIRGAAHRLAGT